MPRTYRGRLWTADVWWAIVVCATLNECSAVSVAADLDEFKVKRQEIFEFAEAPKLVRKGDQFTISFASKGWCDATIAIENAEGAIVRHLASGVLGARAPEPFQKDTLSQHVVWDGKDDQGRYLADYAGCLVRVSLGLKPEFERTLFWEPKKRTAPGNAVCVAPAREGVYVHDGGAVDHVRLFSHDGSYVRTVYPPPANMLEKFDGLNWAEFPQDGRKLPLKLGQPQATFLDSGGNTKQVGPAKYYQAASAVAAHDGKLALLDRWLNRISSDGSTGEMKRKGARVSLPSRGEVDNDCEPGYAPPRSASFSPDGKWVYFTGFHGKGRSPAGGPQEWLPAVLKLDYQSNPDPQVFAGGITDDKSGSADGQFKVPTAVSVDDQGRVFVADYMNDRIQVFDPSGKHLKNVPAKKPASVAVNPKNGEIYVFSWNLVNRFLPQDHKLEETTFVRLKGMDDPKVLASYPLPLVGHHPAIFMNRTHGIQHNVWVDFHGDEPVIWLLPGTGGTSEKLLLSRGDYKSLPAWSTSGLRLLVEKDGKLAEKRDFGKDAIASVKRADPPKVLRQRLYVHPRTGKLYLAEGDSGVMKSFQELVEIDPKTGEINLIKLPLTAEDLAFDLDGLIYLRSDTDVVRFNMSNWQEVPFDYGEERENVGFDESVRVVKKAQGGILLPSTRPGWFHMGGMWVSPRGHLVLSCYNPVKPIEINIPGAFRQTFAAGKPYQAKLYPGRYNEFQIHAWDRRGKLAFEDLVPGIHITDGVAMDKDDNVYVMAANVRVLDGNEYFIERSETLIKFNPGKARITSGSRNVPVVVGADAEKKLGPVQISKNHNGKSWIEGAEWLYGGVGFGGFNSAKGGGGCACMNARFALDLFARSFAPEVDHFSVAVLDTSGNLILRIGKYGNVDDGKPLINDGGPPNRRSIGGDEVALFHAAYPAVHTDRRLFIADAGNSRILSVKLGYHASERLPVTETPVDK